MDDQTLHQELVAKVQYADCERALAAFRRVLDTAGTDAWAAAYAEYKLEGWDVSEGANGQRPTKEDLRLAMAWGAAVEAGRVELCDKAPFVSPQAFALIDFLGRNPSETSEWSFPLKVTKD